MNDNGISPDSAAQLRKSRNLRHLGWAGCAIAALAMAALCASQASGWVAMCGIGALVVLASGAVGALLGFLFAIPRVLTKDMEPEVSVESKPNKSETQSRLLGSNTNLERVSDWLTTMLVGVGLSQLTSINAALGRFQGYLATATDACHQSVPKCSDTVLPAMGPFLLIFGLILGFLTLYLYTRLVLSAQFHRVELDLTRLAGEGAAAVVDAAKSLGERHADNPGFQSLISGAQPSVDDSMNVMLNLLYTPGGYERVIQLGGSLSNTPAKTRADYWFYLAAAFGQKYHILKEANVSEDELASIRDNAIDCARRAVEIAPSYKLRLRELTKPEGVDTDLVDLANDPNLKKIID